MVLCEKVTLILLEREWLCMWWPTIISPFLSLLTGFSPVSSSLLVVQLHQDWTSRQLRESREETGVRVHHPLWELWRQPCAVQLNRHLLGNTGIGRSTTGTCSPHRWEEAHMWQKRRRGKCYAVWNILQHDWFGSVQWWFGKAYPWKNPRASPRDSLQYPGCCYLSRWTQCDFQTWCRGSWFLLLLGAGQCPASLGQGVWVVPQWHWCQSSMHPCIHYLLKWLICLFVAACLFVFFVYFRMVYICGSHNVICDYYGGGRKSLQFDDNKKLHYGGTGFDLCTFTV